jgi:hypothetical protein
MFKKIKKLVQRLVTPSDGETYVVMFFSRDRVFFSRDKMKQNLFNLNRFMLSLVKPSPNLN